MATMKFVDTLTATEMRFARQVKRAGLATVNQAVKALERRDHAQVRAWQRALRERVDASRSTPD